MRARHIAPDGAKGARATEMLEALEPVLMRELEVKQTLWGLRCPPAPPCFCS